MLNFSSPGTLIPFGIIAAAMFFAGNGLWGSYRVDKARAECAQIRNQIIQNAIDQAEELAAQYEDENEKARTLQRRIDALQRSLNEQRAESEEVIEVTEEKLEEATENLKVCLLDPSAKAILNDWLLYEAPATN